MYLANRDPNRWTCPEMFNVERFRSTGARQGKLGDLSISVTTNSEVGKNGFTPFGYGRYQCPSQNMSLSALKLFSYVLFSSYDVEVKNASVAKGEAPFRTEMDFKLTPLLQNGVDARQNNGGSSPKKGHAPRSSGLLQPIAETSRELSSSADSETV